MLTRVLHAPCSFYDSTPQGRILNRFSSDVNQVDHTLPFAMNEVFGGLVDTIIIFAMVFIAIRPVSISIISLIFFGSLYLMVQAFYVPVSRQARRLTAINRSMLLAHCAETAANNLGASIVRAFWKVPQFTEKTNELIDTDSLFTLIRSIANRWLDVRLQVSKSAKMQS